MWMTRGSRNAKYLQLVSSVGETQAKLLRDTYYNIQKASEHVLGKKKLLVSKEFRSIIELLFAIA